LNLEATSEHITDTYDFDQSMSFIGTPTILEVFTTPDIVDVFPHFAKLPSLAGNELSAIGALGALVFGVETTVLSGALSEASVRFTSCESTPPRKCPT